MEIQRRVLSSGAVRWKVRWRQGVKYRSKTFDRKGDAATFAAEVRRRQQMGTLISIDSGRVTLAEYATKTWRLAYAASLAPKTRQHYEQLLAKHVLPPLGPLELRVITPETIARWQADRWAPAMGGSPSAMRSTFSAPSSSAPSSPGRSHRTRLARCARHHARAGARCARWRRSRSSGCAWRAGRATRR